MTTYVIVLICNGLVEECIFQWVLKMISPRVIEEFKSVQVNFNGFFVITVSSGICITRKIESMLQSFEKFHFVL